MMTTESRLRDLLGALADPVEPEPAWQERVVAAMRPTSRPRRHRHSRRAVAPVPRRRPARRLVPALVAVFVLLVVAGAVVLTRGGHQDRGEPPATTATPTATPGAAPPYFMLLQDDGGLTVRDAATGLVTTTVQAPEGRWAQVDASAEPLVFYAVSAAAQPNTYPPTARVYRLAINRAGGLVSTTPIYTWRGSALARISPDGSKIAFQSDTVSTGISVINIGTGLTRTFSANGAGTLGNLYSMRWSQDSRQLLYAWEAARSAAGAGARTGLWALDTTRGGGDLIAASRWVATFDALADNQPLVTVDAHGMHSYVATVETHRPRLDDIDVTQQVVEVDPATGRQIRVLLDVTHRNWQEKLGVLVVDPSGGFLMYDDGGQLIDAIDLATSRVRSIPLNAEVRALAW
jgi:hypothetical protein